MKLTSIEMSRNLNENVGLCKFLFFIYFFSKKSLPDTSINACFCHQIKSEADATETVENQQRNQTTASSSRLDLASFGPPCRVPLFQSVIALNLAGPRHLLLLHILFQNVFHAETEKWPDFLPLLSHNRWRR